MATAKKKARLAKTASAKKASALAKKAAPAKTASAKKATIQKPKGLDSDGKVIDLSSNSARTREGIRAYEGLRSSNMKEFKVAGRNVSDFARNQPSLKSGSMARKPIALGGPSGARGNSGGVGGRGMRGGGGAMLGRGK